MAKIEPRTFKGTRDFLPSEMIRREELFDYLRTVFQRYGFAPLETPAMEFMEILLGKYGVEGEKLIYPLAYKGGKTLALRYDLTVPLARAVAEHHELPRPFKRYQMQPVWRADKPQLHQGRYREFYQCDADIVGEESRVADAEILALVAEILHGLEVGTFQVRLNHRKILEGLVAAAGLPPEAGPAVLRAIDKLDKVGEAGIEAELEREGIEREARSRILTLLSSPSGGRDAIERAGENPHPAFREGAADLLKIWSALEAMGVAMDRFEFRFTLARGLDYYTGAVYEASIDSLPHLGSLAGGGRYDGLVGLFSDEDVPAVGVAIGFDRVLTALEQLGRLPARPTRTEVLVLQFSPESAAAGLSMLGRLRREGIRAEFWYRAERLGKQIQQADRRGIPCVIFQGPEEAERGEWVAKRLDSGEQLTFPEAEVPARLESLVRAR